MIEFIVLLIFFYIAFWQINLILAQAWGAPSVFAYKEVITDAILMAKPQKNQLLLDLGCGDARSLILAVKKFDLRGVGIERSLYCWTKAKLVVSFSGQHARIKILFGDFEKIENYLTRADIVYLYLSDFLMEKNEKWLFAHIKKGAKIVSLSFQFKSHHPIETIKTASTNNSHQHIYLYEVL